MDHPLHVVIFGSGGVGGYFGGRLAQAGTRVSFVARGKHLDALQTSGLTVKSVEGDFVVDPVAATDDPSTLAEADVVLVAVKGWQLEEAAEAMRPVVGEHTMIVPLLNGVEAAERLGRVLGAKRVVGGLCRILSYIEAPGVIRHVGYEPFVGFGERDGETSSRTARLHEALSAAGVRSEIFDNIELEVWRKFLFIAAYGGVAALARVPAGELRAVDETRGFFGDALREIVALAQRQDIALGERDVEGAFAVLDSLPHEATTSMQRDVTEGRPSELHSLSGAVVRIGKRVGQPTPVHSMIYAALLPMENQARSRNAD